MVNELPKYQSFSLSAAQVRYPVDLPEGLDTEFHSCPHCSISHSGDDELELTEDIEMDFEDLFPEEMAEDLPEEMAEDLPPPVMAITFVEENEGNVTPQQIFEVLTATQAMPGEQVSLAIPQNLAVEVFKMLKAYLMSKALKVLRRSRSMSLIETGVPVNRARPLRRRGSFA